MGKFNKLSEFERNLLDGIKCNDNGLPRECIFNAIEHLKKAYEIKEKDPIIALFRAITAEEELSRAIFLVLKDHEYKHSDKLKVKDHKSKQALSFFLGMVQDFFYNSSKCDNFPFKSNIELSFDKNEMLLKLKIPLKGEDVLMSPSPPLNFSISMNGTNYFFRDEINDFIDKSEFSNFQKYIDNKSSFRNSLIYAQEGGSISITNGFDDELERYYNTVIKLLIVYSLIYPYKKEKSEFVQNIVNSFVLAMNSIEI